MKESFKDDDYTSNRELIYVKKYSDFIRNDKNMILYNKLSYIDYSKFEVVNRGYIVDVKPSDIFIKLTNMDNIQLFITKPYNLIDIETHLPYNLRGYGIMFNIYYLLTKYFGYISSNKYCSDDAKNLWYSYMKKDNLYCVTSDFFSYAIDVNVSNEKLIEIYNQVKNRKDCSEYIICDDFKEKLKELNLT
jgi:hypothetical protein